MKESICEICSISSLYSKFQEDYYTSTLCTKCFREMFEDILDIPQEDTKETDYKYQTLQLLDESKPKRTIVLNGKWARIFLKDDGY